MMRKKYGVLSLALVMIASAFLIFWLVKDIKISVMNPKGIIAFKEKNLITISTLLMLIVVVPVFILTVIVTWKYREGKKDTKYTPDWDNSHIIEMIWWGVPCVIIVILSVLTWQSSHELDPFKPLEGKGEPLTIQVIALEWKWLFLYPNEKIATVNFIQFPKATPIRMILTADAPMNSLWIPELSGQIYAMPRMRTELHLIADEVGEFRGSSANLSGTGFAGMTFIAKASEKEEFDRWVARVQSAHQQLDLNTYEALAKPSEYAPVALYALEKEDLFDWVMKKYMEPVM